MPEQLTTRVFVVRDNIDTDQIIPAQYLTLLPTVPEEYAQLGSFAMIGLPDAEYPEKVRPGGRADDAVRDHHCGPEFRLRQSSREHAPIALGAAGLPRGHRGELRAHLFPQQRGHRRSVPV